MAMAQFTVRRFRFKGQSAFPRRFNEFPYCKLSVTTKGKGQNPYCANAIYGYVATVNQQLPSACGLKL
jgi:hypothetical protein